MRTPEQGHTKKCFARAMICAVENLRDNPDCTDVGFMLEVQSRDLEFTAWDYYDGLLDCICPPFMLLARCNTCDELIGRPDIEGSQWEHVARAGDEITVLPFPGHPARSES